MEDTKLIKDYTSEHGRIYPSGSYIACCRETYNILVDQGIAERHPGDKAKKQPKKAKTNGSNK
tara:strand:- start:915 stop:1103 length:189 start_codon:yes stop_codon:yes gene_type:complete